ncbi:MAG: N-6 DNA methylase [Clostridia bacterium]|nr:N-6 DNA methylase [Clostridia bacterium]
MSIKRASGDYQTPPEFARDICRHIAKDRGIMPSAVLEPACGTGSFIKAGLSFNAGKYYGIEINSGYCDICRKEIQDDRVEIINGDFFSCSLDIIERDNLLVIGNPPWVNSSTLSALGSGSRVYKFNFKGLKGIDAMTGSGDFDICEAFIIRIINEFRCSSTAVAMLCKTSVAREVFKELNRKGISFRYCHEIDMDAMKVFEVSASACLLLIQLSAEKCHPDTCNVYRYEDWNKPVFSYRYRDGALCSTQATGTADYGGRCCLEWRQGVKHDWSSTWTAQAGTQTDTVRLSA